MRERLFTEDDAMRLRESAYGPGIRVAFRAQNLPVEWGMAFAYVESGFNPNALRNKGGDARRGGAWGICQMTLFTARKLGFKGKPQELYNPDLCAQYAALLVKQDSKRVGTDFKDVAACYNGGTSYARASAGAKAYADFICKVVQRYAGKYDHEDTPRSV